MAGFLFAVAWAAVGCDPEVPSALPSVPAPSADRATLTAIYNATNGPAWKDDTAWLTSAPLGEWHGVDVNSAGQVVGLDLVDNGLTGAIPAEIGNLSELKSLVLRSNDLTGPVPPWLTKLAGLEVLDLHRNRLSGPVPTDLARISGLRVLRLGFNQLTGHIPGELASLSNLEVLVLKRNAMEGPIPPELGSLSKLQVLDLAGSRVSGPIPPELGNLASLRLLRLADNDLTDAMPTSLLRLSNLTALHLNGSGVCVPATERFLEWLDSMDKWIGTLCGSRDIAVLDRLFATTNGPSWTSSRGWSDPEPPIDRYGVVTDTNGYVTSIDLEENGLFGALPEELGRLAFLRVLRLSDNRIVGELPADLVGLPLRELSYNRTALCVPPDDAWEPWLRTLAVHDGNGWICGEWDDRQILTLFYMLTEGSNWRYAARNWLSRRPLADWVGVQTNAAGRVVGLRLPGFGLHGSVPHVLRMLANLSELRILELHGNSLYGPIPAELAKLQQLEVLNLGYNTRYNSARPTGSGITGPLPSELGAMANLKEVRISFNRIDGAIPRSLGRLARLEYLDISENDFGGPIPRGLARATSLKELHLDNNDLTGSLPSTLGGLVNLGFLNVSNNNLDGPLPPELGQLTKLRGLQASGNRLAGSIPPEFQGLTSLESLYLARNADMAGPLPSGLLNLPLDELLVGGTGLCAPGHVAYWRWIGSMRRRWIRRCEPQTIEMGQASQANAYLIQSVQSRPHPVPLIAGRPALLRVFLATGNRKRNSGNSRGDVAMSPIWPLVRATFFLDGVEVYATDPFSAEVDTVPSSLVEHDLGLSANIEVPARIVQPGLAMTVDFDFAGDDDSWLCCKRIPQQGRQVVDVRVAPPLHLTVLPMLLRTDPDSSVLDAARNLAPSSDLLADLRNLTPVGELHVEVREPVWTSSAVPLDVIREVEAIRVVAGTRSGNHWVGLFNMPRHIGGLAYVPGRTSLSLPEPLILAHEVMHNFNIFHAPCYKESIDAGYPHIGGVIGSVGYDGRTGTLVPATAFDFMANFEACQPVWVSEYHFTQALRHRLRTDALVSRDLAGGQPHQSLLVWGGQDPDGSPFLEPAFVVDAPASMPAANGAWRIVGTGSDGRHLFSFRFDMQEIAHGDGGAGFAFAVPARPEWADALASLTLTGPSGSIAVGQGTADRTAMLLRDRRTGHIRGILRDGNVAPEFGTELEARVSRGIPSPASWRR